MRIEDLIERMQATVSKGRLRKYYRFRSLAGSREITSLVERLAAVDPRLAEVEEEDIIPYPRVMERLHKAGIL